MDIPRRDFTPRFELMETRWHPICTDKSRTSSPSRSTLPLPGHSNISPSPSDRRGFRRVYIGPRCCWIKRLRVAAYASLEPEHRSITANRDFEESSCPERRWTFIFLRVSCARGPWGDWRSLRYLDPGYLNSVSSRGLVVDYSVASNGVYVFICWSLFDDF